MLFLHPFALVEYPKIIQESFRNQSKEGCLRSHGGAQTEKTFLD